MRPAPGLFRTTRKARDHVGRRRPTGKVGIGTGGGSGHLPIFTGYIGPGFLDAIAIGNVFASRRPN
jgi:phosphoenolpyruvate---glycerone phosphotransferase subunit DhaK